MLEAVIQLICSKEVGAYRSAASANAKKVSKTRFTMFKMCAGAIQQNNLQASLAYSYLSVLLPTKTTSLT